VEQTKVRKEGVVVQKKEQWTVPANFSHLSQLRDETESNWGLGFIQIPGGLSGFWKYVVKVFTNRFRATKKKSLLTSRGWAIPYAGRGKNL